MEFQNRIVTDLKNRVERIGPEWTDSVVENSKNWNAVYQSLSDIDRQLTNYRTHLYDNGFKGDQLSLVESAIELVFKEQGLALRKDGSLYPGHPIEVSDKLLTDLKCTNLDLVVAEVLHDIIEDVESYAKNPRKLKDIYGQSIYNMVLGMTNKELSSDQKKVYREGLIQKLKFDDVVSKAVFKHIEYFLGVADKINVPEVCVLKSFDFGTNALNLSSLSHNIPMQSRLANKYLPVVDEFSKNFGQVKKVAKEIGIDPEGIILIEQKFQDAKPQIVGYAKNWENYNAQQDAFNHFNLH